MQWLGPIKHTKTKENVFSLAVKYSPAVAITKPFGNNKTASTGSPWLKDKTLFFVLTSNNFTV